MRPHWPWVVLVGIAELLGVLFLGAAVFESDGAPEAEVAWMGTFLIAMPLPWVVVRIGFPRLWRDIRRFPLALAMAVVAWMFGGIFLLAGSDPVEADEVATIIGLTVGGLPLLWLALRILRLRWQRHRAVRALRVAVPDLSSRHSFSDIPFVIAGDRIYYALDKGLESQQVEGLVWAYGEVFTGWFRCQLALWNREAHAVILPMYVRDVPEALLRLRRAAPWIARGFNRALVDSWNFDHTEFMALIDRHREAGQLFDPVWAADAGLVACAPRMHIDARVDGGLSERQQANEVRKAFALWNKASPVSPP